jgi:hypothetical protein
MVSYSVLKRNDIIAFAGKCMELEMHMLSEINWTNKDKCHMSSGEVLTRNRT